MQFALNYSPQAAELIESGRIDIDFFKTPPWANMMQAASQHRPVAVHFELAAGSGEPRRDWSAVENVLQNSATRYVNFHLNARRKDFPEDFPRLAESARTNRVIERLVADLRPAVQHFGPERVIAENAPYRGPLNSKKLAETALPEVISAAVRAVGCGLLLDISHARISARALGMDPLDYIARLPLESLREVHITGIHTLADGYLQDHLSMVADDWQWLDWLVRQIRRGTWPEPHLLAFEYGGTGPFFSEHSDPDVLAEQVPRLLAAVRSASPPA